MAACPFSFFFLTVRVAFFFIRYPPGLRRPPFFPHLVPLFTPSLGVARSGPILLSSLLLCLKLLKSHHPRITSILPPAYVGAQFSVLLSPVITHWQSFSSTWGRFFLCVSFRCVLTVGCLPPPDGPFLTPPGVRFFSALSFLSLPTPGPCFLVRCSPGPPTLFCPTRRRDPASLLVYIFFQTRSLLWFCVTPDAPGPFAD